MGILLKNGGRTVGALSGRRLSLLAGEEALLRLWETRKFPLFRSAGGKADVGKRIVDGVRLVSPGKPGFEEAFGGACEGQDLAYWVPATAEETEAFSGLPGVRVHEHA